VVQSLLSGLTESIRIAKLNHPSDAARAQDGATLPMIVMHHHRRWLTLFTCASVILLVMHLTDRFAQPGLTIHKTARRGCFLDNF
jgi:hypothetical protein